MSDESWLDDPDYLDAYWEGDDQGIDCDYGLTEFCDNPDLRSMGCCFECDTYLEACEIQDGAYDFAFFWSFTEKGWWADEYDPSIASDIKRIEESQEGMRLIYQIEKMGENLSESQDKHIKRKDER